MKKRYLGWCHEWELSETLREWRLARPGRVIHFGPPPSRIGAFTRKDFERHRLFGIYDLGPAPGEGPRSRFVERDITPRRTSSGAWRSR